MKINKLKQFKLSEAKYDTFIRKIVRESIAETERGKAVRVILRPEN